jgi:hypothetical protein
MTDFLWFIVAVIAIAGICLIYLSVLAAIPLVVLAYVSVLFDVPLNKVNYGITALILLGMKAAYHRWGYRWLN